MIYLKEKHIGLSDFIILLHDTFYHIIPEGTTESGALYKGMQLKVTNRCSGFFSSNDYVYYYDRTSLCSYRFDGDKSILISNKWTIYNKIGEVYLGSNPQTSITLLDADFNEIKVNEIEYKMLLFSDSRYCIYVYWDAYTKDSRHLRVIECTDLYNNSIWAYTAEHLGFYETIKKIKREFDVNKETGESIEKLTILETKQNPILFANGKPLVIGDIMLFGTNNQWIVAIDITSGEELYVIKSIEEAHFKHPLEPLSKPLVKHDPWIGALQYHEKDDVIYAFMNNTYLELDYRTGKLLMIDNRTAEFILLHKICQDRFCNPAYWRVDDIIYYISDMDLEGDKKKATSYLTAYNVKTRVIIFEYPLGKNWKEKCAFHAFKKFQLVDNRFYILDYNSTLWIFEDDEFYNRHPDNKSEL